MSEALGSMGSTARAALSRVSLLGYAVKAAALAAAGTALAHAWLGDCGPLAWLVLVPLFWVSEEDRRPALLLGWVYGTAFWVAALPSLASTLAAFLNVSLAEAAVYRAGVCLAHGLILGTLPPFLRWARSRLEELGLPACAGFAAAAAAAVVSAEAFTPALVHAPLAASQLYHLPLVQIADVAGASVVSALLAWVNAGLYLALRGRGAAVLAAGLAALAGTEAYGLWRLARVEAAAARASQTRGVDVAVLQLWLPPEDRSRERKLGAREAAALRALTEREAGVHLAVWPEFTFPAPFQYDAAGGACLAGKAFRDAAPAWLPAGVPVLLQLAGGFRAGGGGCAPSDGERRNAAVLAGPDGGVLGLSEKTVLVPFGEYMPLGRYLPFLYRMSPRTGRLSPGSTSAPLAAPDGVRVGPLVCYEETFPGPARRLAGQGAEVLASLGNGLWMGRAGSEQVLRLASLRAVETRRYLLRASNSGVSAAIAPSGRVVARAEYGRDAALRLRVPPLEGRTLFVRGGWLFPWAAQALLLGLLAAVLRRRLRPGVS